MGLILNHANHTPTNPRKEESRGLIAPDGNGMFSQQDAFLGWRDGGKSRRHQGRLGGLALVSRRCGGMGRSPGRRETGAAFFRNPTTANSLRRRLLSRWHSGPFWGKLSISAAGNPPWECDLGRLQSREAWVAWEIRSLGLALDLGWEPSSDLAPFKPCH